MRLRYWVAGLVAFLFLGPAARGVQNELVPPTSGIYTGVQYSQKVGDAFRSLASCNKGATAPANVGGSAVDGLCWIDDSATPWIIKTFVNGGWAVIGAYDPSDSTYLGVIGGGTPASIASSTGPVIDLGSVPQAIVNITGTTTLTGFGASAQIGVVKILRFSGALKLTNSGSLAIPGGFDLVTAGGDRAIVTHLGSGNWEVTQYTRANGIPVDISAVGRVTYSFAESIDALSVRGDGAALSRTAYPAYFAKMSRVQSGTRISGNATITLSNTDMIGPGMPVEGTGIGSGCTIASVVTGTSITLNSSSCVVSSGTSSITIVLTGYGSGGSSATVGVPDCIGRVMAGFDPGGVKGRLTATYFGVATTYVGGAAGSESQTLTITQMPVHNHGVTDPGHGHPGSLGKQQGTPGGTSVLDTAMYGQNTTSPSFGQALQIASNTTGISTNNTGGGAAHPIVQPTLIGDCRVRVVP